VRIEVDKPLQKGNNMEPRNFGLGRKTSVTPHCLVLAGLVGAMALPAAAADWSDTAIGYRYGEKFAEPFEGNDIHKNIFNLTHVSGYKYGTNFFNVDVLLSDSKDPANANTSEGAHEVYIVYRHTLDLGKITGKNLSFSIVKDLGLTLGFDFNNKNDAGYNSRKHMLVLGPTLMVEVPGFLSVSLLELWESNAPCNTFTNTCVSRYRYDAHPMLTAAWGIPIGATGLSFEGFANFIAAKGTDEFGGSTKPETDIDMQVMYDLSAPVGAAKNTFKVGLEYQYWKNKFGNDHNGPAGSGAFAKTPMIRAEYHF
jgi:nucleoside-specific outer membrane channel protein Tsx